jgi:peroxiredoxin Q/BCP
MTPVLNKNLPEFEALATGGVKFTPQAFAGRAVVLYFYPKDHTPGCTTEAMQFRDMHPEFLQAGAVVFGVSTDTAASHAKFKTKCGLSVTLLADPDKVAHEAYGAWREKVMYGRQMMGTQRSTFLIGPDGTMVRVWPKVKVDGHAAEVLAALG